MHSDYSSIKTTQKLATHVLFLLKFYRCTLEKNVPTQNQLDSWEDVERVVHHQGLSNVTEIIKIELTNYFVIEKTRQLVARKNTRPAVATYTCLPVTIQSFLIQYHNLLDSATKA